MRSAATCLSFRFSLRELSELTDLCRAEIAEAFPPPVIRLLADAVLPAQLDHRYTAVACPQDVHHLLGVIHELV